VKLIVDQIENAYHDDSYRYSDEENFLDLKARAKKAVALLSRQGKNRTIVVTHHVFLKMLLSYMLYNERLHAGDFIKVSYFNFSDNATVSVAEYHPWKRLTASKGWKIIAYNVQPELLNLKITSPE
jgi:broad specificity phosphatase PhoE